VTLLSKPETWDELRRVLSEAFTRRDLAGVMQILRPMKPRAWAEVLLNVPAALSHPEIVLLLMHAFPDAPAGVFADLLGAFQAQPVAPREQTDLFGDPPAAWIEWPESARAPSGPPSLLLSSRRHLGQFERANPLAQPVPPEAFALLIAKLGRIIDPTQQLPSLLAGWLDRVNTPTVWDAYCKEFGNTYRGEVIRQLWPRLSPKGAVEALGGERWPWLLDGAHPNEVALWSELLRSTVTDAAVRGRALARLLRAGHAASQDPSLEVMVEAFVPLTDGTTLADSPAGADALAKIAASADEVLAGRSTVLGHSLGALLSRPPAQRSAARSRLVDLGICCLENANATTDSLVALLSAPMWHEDEIARKRLASTLGTLTNQRLATLFESVPFNLCVALARSRRTPLQVRLNAAWAAISNSSFEGKDADLSGDPALLAGLFSYLMGASMAEGMDIAAATKHVVIASLNTLVRLAPPLGAYDEQASDWSRLRQGLGSFARRIADVACEHLADRLLAAIDARVDGAPGRSVENLVHAAIRLADPRLKPAVQRAIRESEPQSPLREIDRDEAHWLATVPQRHDRLGWALMMLGVEEATPSSNSGRTGP
jgi:hypothetical protein